MTLIVPRGEDALSSTSDDADSGCLASSPDETKEEGRHLSEGYLATQLKRLSLPDIVPCQGVEGKDTPTPTAPARVHTVSLHKPNMQYQGGLGGTEPDQNGSSECDKDQVILDRADGINGETGTQCEGVTHECRISVDSIPNCVDACERELEGPATITAPEVLQASQINNQCREPHVPSECIPHTDQTNSPLVQAAACSTNTTTNSSTSLDVSETLDTTHPPTREKWSENGDVNGGCGGVLRAPRSGNDGGVNDDVRASEVNGDAGNNLGGEHNSCGTRERESSTGNTGEGHSDKHNAKNTLIIGIDTSDDKSIQSESKSEGMVKCNLRENEELMRNDKEIDIYAAKQKINILRQNFLSSLSADDDDGCDPPDFVVLPHHVDSQFQGEEEDSVLERRSKSEEGVEGLVEAIKIPGCESDGANVGDLQQEAVNKRAEVVEAGAGVEPASATAPAVSAVTVHLSHHRPGTSSLEKEHHGNTPLDDVPIANVGPAGKVSVESHLMLTTDNSKTRSVEPDTPGSIQIATQDVKVSPGVSMAPGSGNMRLGCDITAGGSLEGSGDTVNSSSVNPLHTTPPPVPQLPPTPPCSPPTPSSQHFSTPHTEEDPNLQTTCLKGQSVNLVNLLMHQSRKHKRLHRLRPPDIQVCSSINNNLQHEGGDEAEWQAGSDCETHLLHSTPPPPAQPPRQHGNPHVQRLAANAHCGTEDQLCHHPPQSLEGSPGDDQQSKGTEGDTQGQQSDTSNSNGCGSYLVIPLSGEPPSLADVAGGPTRYNSRVEKCPDESVHVNESVIVSGPAVTRAGQNAKHLINFTPNSLGGGVAVDNQRTGPRATSSSSNSQVNGGVTPATNLPDCDSGVSETKNAVGGGGGGASDNDNVFESDSCCSEGSCLDYLNFERGNNVDSDNEYDIEQKNRLREACKDIARALNALPAPMPQEDSVPVRVASKPPNPRLQYRDQEVEAHLSDSEGQPGVDRLQVSVRSTGTSTASDDERRSSFYDNCGMNGGSCDCGHCHTSDVEDHTRPSKRPPVILGKWEAKKHTEKDRHSCGSGQDTSDYELEDEGFRTDAGEGCRTDEFDAVTTSDDNDYDDDYCQTDDCGEECDYCSGDDAEDEGEDTCYFCKHNQSLSPVCKHPGVITNGILKSLSVRRSHEKEAVRVPRQRSLALQAAIQRRRLTRQGLVAIRESSITSDELPESEEERSNDGSNCDISSSWRYGLCRDMTVSRDSTLRSVRSEKSSSSLPTVKERHRHKEKSNSLPGANSRSLASELTVRQALGSMMTLRQISTSEDESGSHGSLPRLPPRPPRAPRMRPPLTPSPPGGGGALPPASPNSPRPAMGVQSLQQQQQRSPGTPRALHVSGLPVAPRTVAPRSPSNPNPPYGFPTAGSALLCPGSPGPAGRTTPSPGTSEGAPPASPRINSRAGALVTRNFSISDDEGGGRWTGGRRHVTITRHESVYREVAEKGYHLLPGSPVDPYWLTWKLGVLQKTVEDVNGRLEDAEKTAESWGPVPHDPNLADQHAHNVRKFREGLAELQRGIDDVNDQAARFSAHNVPLTPANSAKLHDLNNRWKTLETAVNDRWRKVAGRSREVTPLTPAQLASSVSPPWERATTSNKVPYYINHDQESTHWDHPVMMDLLDSLTEFNHIKFSAYRTATKLRMLQKKLALDRAKMQMATDIFDEHGLRGQNDRLIDVGDMVVVLSALYANISADHPDVNTTLAMDLCLNWLLNVYDSQRTGQMRVLSFKIGLVCLCRGHLEEKYRYMFRLIADPNRLVDQRKLGLLLHDCVQVPRQLGEVAAFGGSNIEPSVRSCFTKAGKDRETIEAVHFLTWVQQEPQSLVWLAVLHRVAASESIQHQVKCNICKAYPIVGLRYRCLKCLSFDMCQRCFFDGRSGKSHKITHPMHEYCTATTAGEDVKDFTKALKNKFKSKRSLQKHTKKGYLPVQTVLEGDPLESPSPSPQHNVTSQDMHSRLELYASRLAEVELRTNSNSTPDSEDEHGLIAQYCQSLSSSDAPLPVPRSPLQIMAAVDAEQKDELEQMIRALEEENSVLQAEYDRLKSQQPVGSPPDDGLGGQRSEAEMLAEAKLLRQHKGRLEARMGILEEHNRQLEAQLHRLRQLLGEPGGMSSPNKSGTLQTKSVTASQLAMDSPAKVNGHSNQVGASSAYDGLEQMSEYVRPPPPPMGSVAHVGNLFSRAAPYSRGSGWRPGEGSWHSGGHNDPRGGERLA
ncbi:uncharacterized protein LOC121860057 isoform X2 [Homarus americanus]|uniref:uncharacterized protein LOC121860057 isoform X2 n=1 Tax=Homarus americanus TaxID=6706 RepID=UPI001C4656B2|nr:uncharacterized protein LOC121860057 isoform X2 [Homarus americanus]